MRPFLTRAALSAALLTGAAAGAQAQIQQLPSTSRGEAQSNAINNSLSVQQQNRAADQQTQFEVNSLRNQSSRSVSPPSVVVAPPIAGPRP